MNEGLHISLAPEVLGTFFGIPITSTLISSWAVLIVLILTAYLVGKNPKLIPGPVQNFFEMLFDFVLDYMEKTLGTRDLAIRFFPLITTIFLFIFTANLFDFLPFFGSIGFWREGTLIPLFAPVNTDLNVTLALAIMVYFVIEITGVVMLGFLKYGSKFVNFRGGVLGFIIGIIELVSNLARLVSFSFRLFGNVFAGEVLIAVVISFLPYILPVPLMFFETLVGLVQAAIFALLTLVFIKIAITEPHELNDSHKTAAIKTSR